MSSEKIIKHPVIGEYKIVKSSRSRTIRLSVHANKGVQITIPLFASYQQASAFLETKLDWVCNSLEKQKEKAKKMALAIEDGTTIQLINGRITFKEVNCPLNECSKVTIEKKRLINESETSWLILYPFGIKAKQLEPSIILVIKEAAQSYLPQRTQYLASKHRFQYNRLSLKNNKSNWGSCSSLNNINLNIHLMRLSPELCDYVILHELTHLKHRNHGKEFHIFLNWLCDGHEKELSNRLKQFCPTI